MVENLIGPDARAQQNLAWTPDASRMTSLGMNIMARQQQAAQQQRLLNERQKRIAADVAAKQSEVFKQGPHDAGRFTSIYNEEFYKPFATQQFERAKSGQINPTEFNYNYSNLGAAANVLKNEGNRFEETINIRKQENPNYNWGVVEEKVLGRTKDLLKKHLQNGYTVESFRPNYNTIVEESIQESNDFLAPRIAKDVYDQTLKGDTTKKVRFKGADGTVTEDEILVPNFVRLDKNNRIAGLDHSQIVDAFTAVPAGEGYLKQRVKEIYNSDPAFKEKFETFKNDKRNMDKLLYEAVVRPVIKNPLSNRDVRLSTATEMDKTTDEELEQIKVATPILSQTTIPKLTGNADFMAPTAVYSLTEKQFNKYKRPLNIEQFVMTGNGRLTRIKSDEQFYNDGLADGKVEITSLPVLKDRIMYKSGDKLLPAESFAKGEQGFLTPERVDGVIKQRGSAYVNINPNKNQAPKYIRVDSGDQLMSLATPQAPWVKYVPYAKINMVGAQGPFQVKKEETPEQKRARLEGKPVPEDETVDQRFSGTKANPTRYIRIDQSAPGFIYDIMNNAGKENYEKTLRELQQKTYLDFIAGRTGQPDAQVEIP